jgi:hypothetical protein
VTIYRGYQWFIVLDWGQQFFEVIIAMGKLTIVAEFVEKLKGWKVTKKTTSKNVLRCEIFDRGLCFDGPYLMVFELTGLFQQFRLKTLLMTSFLLSSLA